MHKNYLKRILIIAVLFCAIGIIVSLFLPSQVILSKKTVLVADEKIVQERLKTFKYGSLLNFIIVPENETWSYNDLDEGLQISSTIKIDIGFNPWRKYSALLSEEKLDENFQLKFDSIKLVLEELPKIQSVEVQKIKMKKDLWFLAIRDTINPLSMNNLHGKLYAEINQFMLEEEHVSNQPPLVIYHFWSDTLVDIEVGVEVDDTTIIGNGRIKMNKINLSNVVTATHSGAYERLPETYFGINEWMRNNKVVVTGPPWEVYITDPITEANPKKWRTAIFFPVN